MRIARELTGGIYFGEPRGIRTVENGEQAGYHTMVYSTSEIQRIGKVAFELAKTRAQAACSPACIVSIGKTNVLEVAELWRQTMI